MLRGTTGMVLVGAYSADEQCEGMPNGTACSHPCFLLEMCINGECTSDFPITCGHLDNECATYACDPDGADGNCDLVTPMNEGGSCEDSSECTFSETCQSGECTGPALDCDDGFVCNGMETCHPVLGCLQGQSDPCPGQLCDPELNACVDCFFHQDCDDDDDCTADICEDGQCENSEIPGCEPQAIIELLPLYNGNGCALPGQPMDVELRIEIVDGMLLLVPEVDIFTTRFNVQNSSPELELQLPEMHPGINFWNFETQENCPPDCGAGYSLFADLDLDSRMWIFLTDLDTPRLSVERDGPALHMGTIRIIVPDDPTEPLMLDVVTPDLPGTGFEMGLQGATYSQMNPDHVVGGQLNINVCDDVPDCDDGNPCTNDLWDALLQQCLNQPMVCDPGLYCEPQTGQCVPEPDCDDGNSCTDDLWDALIQACINTPMDCDDGDPCSVDVCEEGSCENDPIPGCSTPVQLQLNPLYNGNGCALPGTTIPLQLGIYVPGPSGEWEIEYTQIDVSGSDPELQLEGQETHPGIGFWRFDTQDNCPPACGAGYSAAPFNEDLPFELERIDDLLPPLKLFANVPLIIGELEITVPTTPGNYILDAVTPTLPDTGFTMLLYDAHGHVIEVPGAATTGGQLDIPVCEEANSCETTQDCADLDGNGIRDDSCTHWACVGGVCQATGVPYADLGGSNGACAPDQTADGNDRFHALNCFANRTTLGDSGYACEDNPPQAFNVDVAGLNAPCSPDGVCDGNDAFAATNAFANATTCSCEAPMPNAPQAFAPPQSGQASGLILETDVSGARPGDVVAVHVYLDAGLDDLRGYQLHVATSGGDRGSLDLVDIVVEPFKNRALEGELTWSAFNTDTAQMLVGMNADGVEVASDAYLATYVYRVSDDAVGTFTVDALHDRGAPQQRTVLFATPASEIIDIVDSTSAVIRVASDNKSDRSRKRTHSNRR